MSDPSGIGFRLVLDADIPTPATGKVAVYFTVGGARYKSDDGVAHDFPLGQPLDSDLTAIAALATTTFGRSFLVLSDAAAARALLVLGTAALNNTGDFDAVGTATAAIAAHLAASDPHSQYYNAIRGAAAFDALGAASAAQSASQPLDSDLTAVAALATTAFGRSFLILADAAAARTQLALGTAATQSTTAFDAAGAAASAQAASQPLDSDLTAIAALVTTAFGRSFLDRADASAARTLLALGSAALNNTGDFQPIDSDLTAIAALVTTSFGRSFLALADATAARTLLALGSAATQNTSAFDASGAAAAAQAASQPLDSDLTAIAALATTAFGRSFLDRVDASAARTLLALGSAALNNTGDFDTSGAAAAAQAASQPLDSDLTAIAALVTTSFGRSFLPLANAAAARTLLALGSAALNNTGDFDTSGAAAAAQAASQPLDSDLTAIAALVTTAYGRGQLVLASATADTAQLDQATTALKGLMSPTDKKRTSQVYDAVADFGFVGDLITTNGTSTLTGAVLTDTTNPFVAGDVGKRITVPFAGAGSGVNALQLTTTILSFQSANQVTLNVAATNNRAGVAVSYGTDNTAAITAMQTLVNTTNAAFPGVRIVFGQSATNAYGFPIGVVFNKPVQLEGIGGGHTADTGDYTRIGGTRLAWWGTSSDGGTPFSGFIEIVPTGVQALKHVALRHIWLDCRNNDQNQALFGLKLTSCHGFSIDDFFVMDALAKGLWLATGTTPTEAKDTTRFLITNYCSRQLDNCASPAPMTTPILMTSAVTLTASGQSLTVAANTLPTAGYLWTMSSEGVPVLVQYTGGGGTTTLTGCRCAAEAVVYTYATVANANIVQATPGNGTCLTLDGGSGANACCGVILMLQLSHGTTWGPAALDSRNSDSIDFIQIMINGGNATNDGAINRNRKPGVRLAGSNNATLATAQLLACRNHTFRGGDPGVGGVSVMGVTNAAARLVAMSGPHYWDLYQLGNGAALPTIEGNAAFDWSPNGGWRDGARSGAAIVDQAIAATLTLITGTLMAIPPQGNQIGTTYRWKLTGLQTAAAVGAVVLTVRYGTAGTTADAAIMTITFPTSTVAAATSFELDVGLTIRTLGASATCKGKCTLIQGSAAGIGGALSASAPVPVVATFDSTSGTGGATQKFIHLDLITGGVGTTVTFECVTSEIVAPSNP